MPPTAALRRRFARLAILVVAHLATMLLLPGSARAGLAASDLCTGNPCLVARNHDLDAGTALDLDFGAVDVVVESSLTWDTTDVTLIARSLEIRRRGQLRGNGDLTIRVDDYARLNGTRDTGTVRLTGDSVTLAIESLGSVFASGSIRLIAEDTESDGGTLQIEAGTDVELRGAIEGVSGNLGEGGTLDIDAGGGVVVIGALDLTGGEFGGGTVVVDADGSVIFGAVDLDGNGELSDGGSFEVLAGGDVLLSQRVRVRGSALSEDCGDGGMVDIASQGTLQISREVDLRARTGDCCGGSIDLSAPRAIIRGTLNAVSDGGDGCGGDVSIDALDSLEVTHTATIDVRGAGAGGDITMASDGEFVARPGCMVDAGGRKGSVTARSTGDMDIDGTWRAGADSAAAGGTGDTVPLIELIGCRLAIGSDASITARGNDTANRITALGSMAISGSLSAGLANILTFPPGVTPIVSGAVQPVAVQVVDSKLVPCIALPTTSPRPSPTASPRPTPTTSPTTAPTALPSPTVRPPATFTSAPPTAAGSPTPTPSPNTCSAPCPADCDGSCQVSISELILAVQISLGEADVTLCPAADRDDSGNVSIAELIAGVGNALSGCSP